MTAEPPEPSHHVTFHCCKKHPGDAAKSVVYLYEEDLIGLYFDAHDENSNLQAWAYLTKPVAREYAARILELCDADF